MAGAVRCRGPGHLSSDHRPYIVEVLRDFAFALLLYPLIASEVAKLRMTTVTSGLLAILCGGSRTAGPLDQLEPSVECHTPWICEWKCRGQNDSLMFSGRGNAQMGVSGNVRDQ